MVNMADVDTKLFSEGENHQHDNSAQWIVGDDLHLTNSTSDPNNALVVGSFPNNPTVEPTALVNCSTNPPLTMTPILPNPNASLKLSPSTQSQFVLIDGVLYSLYNTTTGLQVIGPPDLDLDDSPDSIEIPQHLVDHMYAKKAKTHNNSLEKSATKRRYRKKDRVPLHQTEEQEDVQEDSPRINIIRQRLPNSHGNVPGYSGPIRPSILKGNAKSSQQFQKQEHRGTDPIDPRRIKLSTRKSLNDDATYYETSPPRYLKAEPSSLNSEDVIYKESEIPQVGAHATAVIGDIHHQPTEDSFEQTSRPYHFSSCPSTTTTMNGEHSNNSESKEILLMCYEDLMGAEEGSNPVNDSLLSGRDSIDENEFLLDFPIEDSRVANKLISFPMIEIDNRLVVPMEHESVEEFNPQNYSPSFQPETTTTELQQPHEKPVLSDPLEGLSAGQGDPEPQAKKANQSISRRSVPKSSQQLPVRRSNRATKVPARLEEHTL